MPLLKGVKYDPPVIYRGERILALARKLLPRLVEPPDYIDPVFAASVYYTMFLPLPLPDYGTRLQGDRKTEMQHMLLRAIISSPKFRKVRKHTIADLAASTAAAAVLLESLINELSRNRGQPSPSRSDSSKGEESGDTSRQEINEETIRQSVDRALEAARDVAQQAKEISQFALTFSAGSASSLSLEDAIQDVINLARNTDVKILLEMLRTIEDTESIIRRRKTRSPRGELDGYEKGNDLERLVPSELVLPTELFLVRYAERSLLLYKKVVSEDYGPFYVLLDKSGSMMGMKMLWAKAVALALAQRAARENREFYIRFFDSIPYPPLHIPRRIRGKDVVRLLEYVARIRANGGTDISRAILTATEDILSSQSRFKPADIILITDGEDRVSVELIRKSLNKANARLYTVMVYGNNPDLRRLSDAYMVATKTGKEEALRVVSLAS